MANKLELTWVGKDEEIHVEPRILLHDASKDYGDKDTENMLIHGDNLLALKALEQEYSGRIKCIYIDPPYNTGEAFELYDDNLEHSIWLSLMRERLLILKRLLAKDGTIWIQIDDEEQAYLKVLCDEIFGRQNFINIISVNMKNVAGASGGGEDKRLKKNCEFILSYSNNYDLIAPFKGAYDYTEMYKYVTDYRDQGKNWHYTSVLYREGEKKYVGSTEDGEGNEIRIYTRINATVKSIRQIMADEGLTEKEVYYKYGSKIFEAKDAQSSIRTRVREAKKNFGITDDILSIEYVPKTGKNKGKTYEQFYKGDKCRLFAWLKDISEEIDGILYKKDLQGTYWDFTSNINNLSKEGGIVFPKGKKPEALVGRIIEMTTNEGDLVLDSFLGSGTTAAVAHKMRRKYIGIEFGNQCYTLCKPRLDRVVEGEQSGISKTVNWKGGGGYKFYELAPSLVVEDKFGNPIINKEYNADMLAAAMALHEGFTYAPDSNFYWKQGKNENAYIYTTTNHITAAYLDSIESEMQENEYLIIACKSFDSGVDRLYKNITVKKIPQTLLGRCEFGKDNYNLNIIDVPVIEDEDE